MEPVKNKRFISFEGIDYSGKTTQINLLKTYLTEKGFKVYVFREPGGTAISEKIRGLLLDKKNYNMDERAEIFLYSAARAQLVREKIMPMLREGYFVIADRYFDSTTAYQGYGRKIDLKTVRQINAAAIYGLLPNITFYLKITPEQAAQRRRQSGRDADRLEGAGYDFFKRVFNGYDKIAENNKNRYCVINATDTIENIQEKIIQMIESKTMD